MTYLEFFGNVRDLNLLSILLRFVLAVLCSGVIGLERGRRQALAFWGPALSLSRAETR